MTLLWAGLGLLVAGFALNVVGGLLRNQQSGIAQRKSLPDLIVDALVGTLTNLRKALRPGPLPDKLEAFGSVLAMLGFALIVLFIVGQLTPNGGGDEASPLAS